MAYIRTVAALALALTVVTGCAGTPTAEDCQTREAAIARNIDNIDEASAGMFRALANLDVDELQEHYNDMHRLLRGFEDRAEQMLDACAPHKTAEELAALEDEVNVVLSDWEDIQQACRESYPFAC